MTVSHDFGEVYCGRRLATALAFLCDYNLIKRSEIHSDIMPIDSKWTWLDERSARSISRVKRQVVTECCDKPCTENELLSYCGN